MSMTTLTTLGRCAAVLSSVTLFAGYMWYQSRGAVPQDVAKGSGNSRSDHVPGALVPVEAGSPELKNARIITRDEFAHKSLLLPGSKSSAFDLLHDNQRGPEQRFLYVEPVSDYAPALFAPIDANENYTFAAPAKNADPRQAAQKQAEDAKRQIFMSSSKSGAVFKEWRVIPHTGETVAPQRRVLMAGSKSAMVGIYKSDAPAQAAAPNPEKTVTPQRRVLMAGSKSPGIPVVEPPARAPSPVNPASGWLVAEGAENDPAAKASEPAASQPARQPATPAAPNPPLPQGAGGPKVNAPQSLDTSFRYADPAPPPEPVYVPRRRVLMSSSKSGRVYEGDDLPPIRVPVPSQSAVQK
jgi:hypothetical protein